MLCDDGAILDDHEVGNGSHAKTCPERRLRFRVNLQDERTPSHFTRDVSHDGSGRPARAAP